MPTPSIPDWESMNFAEGDTIKAIEKPNAQNEALQTFSTDLVQYVEESAEALLTAGGTIFPTISAGMAAADVDGYFYAENPDPNISKTLYQKISVSDYRKVADDPSAEFVLALESQVDSAGVDIIANATNGRLPISSYSEIAIDASVDEQLGYSGGEDVTENHDLRINAIEQLGGRLPISTFDEAPINAVVDRDLGYSGGDDVSENHDIRIKAIENSVSFVYRGHIGQGQSNARGAGEPTPSALTSSAGFSETALMPDGVDMNVALGTGLGGSYELIDPADFQVFQGLKSEQLSASNGTNFLEGLGFRQASIDQQAGMQGQRVYWTAAEGGVSLAARSPGTDAYSNTLAAIEKSVDIAALNGGSYVVESIHSIEGEADTATVDFDDALINVYASQLTADIKSRTGQKFDPWIIASQPSSFYGSVEGALGIYRACRDNPRFNLASAGYHLPYYSDLLHYSPLGHLLMGEYHQKVLQSLRRGDPWRPVSPKFIQWDGGSSLKVWFHAPVLPIVLDPAASHHGDFGFVVRSDAQDMDIAAIDVVGPDCIEITTVNPIGANRSLQYAMRGYQSSPRVEGDGPKGALRDSDDRPSIFDGRPLYNWGVHFVENF